MQTIPAGGFLRTYTDPGELENAMINRSVKVRDWTDGQCDLTTETANDHIDQSYHAASRNPPLAPTSLSV